MSELYASRSDPAERQRLLVTILEHCTIREGVITPSYRPPWDTIAKMAAEKKAPPASLKRPGRRSLEIQRWGRYLEDQAGGRGPLPISIAVAVLRHRLWG